MEPVKPREGGRTHPGLTVVPPRIGDSRTGSVSRGNAPPQIAYCHGSHTAAPLSGSIISSALGLSSAVRQGRYLFAAVVGHGALGLEIECRWFLRRNAGRQNSTRRGKP